jgi:hypothetical protein
MSEVVRLYDKQETEIAREFARTLAEDGPLAATELVQEWSERRARLRTPTTPPDGEVG